MLHFEDAIKKQKLTKIFYKPYIQNEIKQVTDPFIPI